MALARRLKGAQGGLERLQIEIWKALERRNTRWLESESA
jgi:hypothetical protein